LIAAYLALTALLAAADAAACVLSWRGTLDAAPGAGWVQFFWATISGVMIAIFRNRGLWAGAPIAHASYVGGAFLVVAGSSFTSGYWFGYRIVACAVVLALSLATLAMVLSGRADEGETPSGAAFGGVAAGVFAALASGAIGKTLPVPSPTAPPPVAAAPAVDATPAPAVPYRLHLAGRVLRPDGVALPGVTVTVEFDAAPGSEVVIEGEPTVRANGTGAFELGGHGIGPALPFRLTFRAPLYKPKTISGTTKDPGNEAIQVVLSPDL
jgi:hypothetical protein